jgi:hypothetical protein
MVRNHAVRDLKMWRAEHFSVSLRLILVGAVKYAFCTMECDSHPSLAIPSL